MLRISLIVLCILMTACGQAELQVQVVSPIEATQHYNRQSTQTPNEQDQLLFQDEASGIYFLYPATWEVNTYSSVITVGNDRSTLFIEYSWFNETDMPAENPALTDDLEASDPIVLLGNERTTYLNKQFNILYYTSPQDAVAVHNQSFAPFIVANVGFSIRLEIEDLTELEQIRTLTDVVVESFGFTWLITRPSVNDLSNWNSYQDAETDLQFQYPDDWSVTRTSDAIIIQSDDIRLLLFINSGPGGIAAGDLRKGDPTHIWLNATAIPRVYLVYDDKIKSLFYGQPGSAITIEDNNIVAIVDSSAEIAYESINLSPDKLHQADLIVSTLRP